MNYYIRLTLIIVLFIVIGGFSFNRFLLDYKQEDTVDISSFPLIIGSWTGVEMPIEEDALAILETNNAFMRKYTDNNGHKIYLYVVYSQHNRKVAHPPEVCYTGSGYSIEDVHTDAISLSDGTAIQAKSLLIEYKGIRQLAYYWFKVGKQYTDSYWKQQSLIFLSSLKTIFESTPASSALIRISAEVKDSDTEQSAQTIKEFTRLIMPSLNQHLP